MLEKVRIPKLEAYSGYEDARPLWLLMKEGQVLLELNSANPPKLKKCIETILAGQQRHRYFQAFY